MGVNDSYGSVARLPFRECMALAQEKTAERAGDSSKPSRFRKRFAKWLDTWPEEQVGAAEKVWTLMLINRRDTPPDEPGLEWRQGVTFEEHDGHARMVLTWKAFPKDGGL